MESKAVFEFSYKLFEIFYKLLRFSLFHLV